MRKATPPTYRPRWGKVQERLNETLRRYLSEGRIDNLSVAPEYKGKSLVPAKIRVSARKDGRVGEFTTVIGIW